MTTMCDLYLRLSDGRDLATLDARERVLRAEAGRRGWEVHRVVIENDLTPNGTRNASAFKRRRIPLPNGKTAMRVVRPGFRSVLDDLAEGRVGALLTEDLDRVVRDPRDGEDLLDVVEERRATADSVSGSLRLTNGGTDAEVYGFRSLVNSANKASRDTARRVSDGRQRTAYIGQWGGGRRPYGFTPVPNPSGNHTNTVLVPDPDEAAVIRDMAEQVLKGISLGAIAQGLREREVPTVTGVRWTAETVKDVLSKKVCAGIVVHKGQDTGVRLADPILTEETWNAVVARLNSPVIEWTDRSGKTHTAKRQQTKAGRTPTWLGTGTYLCPCGSTVDIQCGRNRARSYKCGRDANSTGSVHIRRNAAQVDEYVSRSIVERLANADTFSLLVKQAQPEVDVDALRLEARTLRARLDDLAAALAEGEIDRQQMAKGSKRLRAKLDEIDAQLASSTSTGDLFRLVSPFNPLAHLADTAAVWLGLSLGERRALVKQLCRVTILPTAKGCRGFDPSSVKIEWL